MHGQRCIRYLGTDLGRCRHKDRMILEQKKMHTPIEYNRGSRNKPASLVHLNCNRDVGNIP